MPDKSQAKNLHEMQLLLRISKQISAIDNLDELLYAILEICTQETDAERGTLFLADQDTGELYSRIAQGLTVREIRVMNNQGIAGAVFRSGTSAIIHDAYADPRFDASTDEWTNFKTRNLVCVPIRFRKDIIGVLQLLNKKKRRFTNEDVHLLEAMAEQTAIALRSVLFIERMKATRQQEMQFLEFVGEVTGHLDLGSMLNKIVTEAARMLKADRATLFLHDEKKHELFSRVAMGESDRRDPHSRKRRDRGRGIHCPARPSTCPTLTPICASIRPFDKQHRLLHPLHSVRADREQERQNHRRHPGAEQARRPVHGRGRDRACAPSPRSLPSVLKTPNCSTMCRT